MPGENRDDSFKGNRPNKRQLEDYQPPARPRAGEDIPADSDEDDGDDGHDEVGSITS